MECLNYKKGLPCSNYQCQFGYINCANFQCNIWDFNKCRNYDLEPSEADVSDFVQCLNKIGISCKNEDGSLKSMYKILEEASRDWEVN